MPDPAAFPSAPPFTLRGRVVSPLGDGGLLDLADGRAEPIGPGGADILPTYAGPAEGIVYVARSLHPVQIVALSLDGGAPTTVAANGASPAVTPDGRLLAYTYGGAPSSETAIMIRNLADGSERALTSVVPEPDWVSVNGLTFSADGRRLAFVWIRANPDDTDDVEREIRVVDVATAQTLDDAVAFGPGDPGRTWVEPTFRGRFDTLAVVEQSRSGPSGRSTVLSVDPATGEVLATLFMVNQPVASLDADASGFHLVFSVEDGSSYTVYRWSGGEPELVGTGLAAAIWE